MSVAATPKRRCRGCFGMFTIRKTERSVGKADGFLLDEYEEMSSEWTEPQSNDAPMEPVPFLQQVEAGDAIITVTAKAGAFPEGATLVVGDDFDKDAARAAAEAAMSGEVMRHHLYRIDVLDGAGNPCLPDYR